MLNKLKEAGFKENNEGIWIRETDTYTIEIDPHTKKVCGYNHNEETEFSRAYLEDMLHENKLHWTVKEQNGEYFIEEIKEREIAEAIYTPQILPSLEEMMELAPYVSGEELEQGVKVKFLTSWEKVGEWNYKGRVTPKYSIFLVLLDDEHGAQLRRLDCGRNLISYLIGAMFLNNVRDIRGRNAEIQRVGAKQNTRYKIKFLKE